MTRPQRSRGHESERIYREILASCKSHLQNITTTAEYWDAMKDGLSKVPGGTYDQCLLDELEGFVQADREMNAQAYMHKVITATEYAATRGVYNMVDATIERLQREKTPT